MNACILRRRVCCRRFYAFAGRCDVIKTRHLAKTLLIVPNADQLLSILARTARECSFCWAWRPLWENCCCYWSQYRPRLRSCETLCSNESRQNHSRMSKQRARRGCSQRRDQSATIISFRISFFTYKDLKTETGYESAELRIIDLARISSVVDFAERFEKEGGRIDILLLNAGIVPFPGQQLTADGYEPVSVIRS